MKTIFGIILLITAVYASSHSEAPGTASAPSADLTDFYMFRSYETGREDYVTIIANIYPLQSPFGGPNYFSLSTKHFYEINLDNDGDAVADMTFRMMYENRLGGERIERLVVDDDTCGNNTLVNDTIHSGLEVPIGEGANRMMVPVPLKFIGPITTVASEDGALNWFEYYTVELNGANITNAENSEARLRKPFDYAGTKSFPNYAQYVENNFIYDVDFPNCGTAGKMFLGQRKESFPVALGKIFDLINMVPLEGSINECEINDDLREKNVVSWAIEIPTSCIVGPNDDVVGGWATVRELLHLEDGSHAPGAQVSRLGQPLVNEAVIGLPDKGIFNLVDPTQDGAVAFYVTHPTLPFLVDALFREALSSPVDIAPSNIPRDDLFTVFLTGIPGLNEPTGVTASEMLRLNTSTPITPMANQESYGVIGGDSAGFPNGRRPGDDVVDIALRVLMGALCDDDGTFGCTTDQAPVGSQPFTDGAPNSAMFFDSSFPYMKTPLPGATDAVGECEESPSSSSDTTTTTSSASNFASFLSFF